MKFWNFIAGIIRSDGRESHKRVIAIYVTVVLVTFVVIKWTDKDNSVSVLQSLLYFVGGLVGLAVTQYGIGKLRKSSTTPPPGDPPGDEPDDSK